MKFKNLWSIISGMLLMAILSSCTKEGVDLFEGNYSFKTSGTLTIEKTLLESIDESAEPTTETLALTTESGQMNILKEDDSHVIITMNIIGSDVLVMKAEVRKDILNLTDAKRTVSLRDGTATATLDCTVSGYAKKYDDTVIFTLHYEGAGSSTLHNYTITSSEVTSVARINK